MKTAGNVVRSLVAYALVTAVLVVPAAHAAPLPDYNVEGFNSHLDGTGGNLFVPLIDATSGILGELIPGESRVVGLDSEMTTLSGIGDTAEGWVEFLLQFNLGGSEVDIDPQSIELNLFLEDVDFKPVLYGTKGVHTEWLDLTFLLDADDIDTLPPGTPPDFTLHTGNFGFYRQDVDPGLTGFDMPTNNATAHYLLSLMGDLGVTQADFDNDIDEDHEFALLVRLTSHVESLTNRSWSFRNTDEEIGTDLFFVAPEPGTLILLAIGGALLCIRRKR